MPQGVSKALKKEIRSVLGRIIGFPPGTEGFPRYSKVDLTREAIEYLVDLGVL